MSLFDGYPRPTDATAMSNCELLVIKHQDFMPFLRSEPDLGLQFIEVLWLRRTSKQVEDGTFLDLPTRLARMLLRLTAASAPTGTVAITLRHQSALAPENLTTLPHFSVSSAISLPKSAGEPASTVPPRSASRAFMLRSARPALISLLSLSTISTDVFFGAPIPTQLARLVARHELGHGRDAGQRVRARRGGYCERAQRASPDIPYRRDSGGEHDLHLPAEQIGERRSATTIRHVNHVDAGHHLEQLAGHMGRCRASDA